jgi:hypothetical protein
MHIKFFVIIYASCNTYVQVLRKQGIVFTLDFRRSKGEKNTTGTEILKFMIQKMF